MAESKVVAVGRSADPSTLGVGRGEPRRLAGGRLPRVLVPARVVRPRGRSSRSASPSPSATTSSTRRSRRTVDTLAANGLFFGLNYWDVDPDVWQEQACLAAGRNLTVEEWRTFIGADVPYAATCPRWPGADGTGSAD